MKYLTKNLLFLSSFIPYFSSFLPFIAIIPYIVIICSSWKKVKAVWNNIRQICLEESGNGIRYELRDEHFGGCNKQHVRRYYVMVDIDEEKPPASTPVVAVAPVINATKVPESATSNTTPVGGTTSIFDQLKG